MFTGEYKNKIKMHTVGFCVHFFYDLVSDFLVFTRFSHRYSVLCYL